MIEPTNFDQFSTDYKRILDQSVALSGEGAEYFAEYKARYIARTVGRDFSGKILDYGCGVGLLATFLKKHLPAATIHGYDVSGQSIAMASIEFSNSNLFSSDLEQMHHDYRMIVISNVMHHVPKPQRQQFIDGIATRIGGCGMVVIFEHNPLNPMTRWVVKHCPFDSDAVLLRPSEASYYLSQAQLSVRRRDYLIFFPKVLSFLRRLEPTLFRFPLGAQYALIGARHE